jgi:hypothetical protein
MHTGTIHILQTNIQYQKERDFVLAQLHRIPSVRRASVDLDDKDRILRVECDQLSVRNIINILSNIGISGKELED